jgi:sulfur carrier protein
MIGVSVNGEVRRLEEGTTVAELVGKLVGDERGVAVALNAEVVRRSDWARTVLVEGDRVEVLRAAQGGC